MSELPSDPKREKRDLILDAAIEVFASKGYHGARVSDIAREAGIAYGLVYHYFKNKEEILSTIFEERWTGFLEAVEDVAGSSRSAEDRLLSVAALVLNGYRLHPQWVKVLVLEIQRSSRFSEPTQLRAVGRLVDAVERIVRSGQESGELRKEVDPSIAAYVFMGALDLVITGLVLGVTRLEGGEEDARAYHLSVAQNLMEIFARGIASQRGGGGG
ncbi:MAG: TetR/AcrR family transcriptional regulator [Myxococcota bacterium]|nr:TetR/AcrR family transcriptional regulator [Myxococcota bacterium]